MANSPGVMVAIADRPRLALYVMKRVDLEFPGYRKWGMLDEQALNESIDPRERSRILSLGFDYWTARQPITVTPLEFEPDPEVVMRVHGNSTRGFWNKSRR